MKSNVFLLLFIVSCGLVPANLCSQALPISQVTAVNLSVSPTVQPVTISPTEQTEIDAAQANTRDMSTAPRWISGIAPGLGDSEKALGHHGSVTIRGLVGIDGKLRFTAVESSSRSLLLDQLSLDAAKRATFSPALSRVGVPIPVMVSLPFEYFAYNSASGFGAAEYTCRQFVLDEDWAKATFAQWPGANKGFYTLIRGLSLAADLDGLLAGKMLTAESDESFNRRWSSAVEACRRRQTRRFAEIFKPEGTTIDRLAASQGWRK